MTIYPTIATLHYKDKNINMKIPLLIKLIKMKKFRCPDCRLYGSETELHKRYEWLYDYKASKAETHLPSLKVDWDRRLGIRVMTNLSNGNGLFCPDCLLDYNKKVPMTSNENNLLKVYTNAKSEYIDISKILYDCTDFKLFRKRRHKELSIFYEVRIEGIMEILEGSKTTIKLFKKREKRKKPKITLTVDKTIDMKRLEEDYQKYLSRKTIRAL